MWKLLALLILTISCNPSPEKKPEPTAFSGTAMTIPYKILVGSTLNQEESSKVRHIIEATFDEVDLVYNKYNPNSEVSQFNKLDSYLPMPISHGLSALLQETADLVLLTEGRFDPTVEAAGLVWRSHLETGSKPSDEEIASAGAAVGWYQIHQEGASIWKENPNTQIDLGGIAKGLTVDMLTERLIASGFRNVFVEWGGEIRAAGKHPEGRPWTVYISKLQDTNPDNAVAFITLDNQSVATSGDYLQNWTVGDTTYTHIIDPLSLRPIIVTPKSIASVTVVAPSCSLADALATAAMIFPNAESAKIWAEDVKKKNPDVSFWILTRE